MKITKVDPKTVDWGKRGRPSVNAPIYNKIRELKIDESIRVELDKPQKNFSITVHANFRRKRNPDFKIRSHREDKEGKVWFFQKRNR